MTRTLPTGWPGRALALGLAFILVATLWIAVAQPLSDWYGERAATLAQRAALVQRMAQLATSLPSLQSQLAGPAATRTVAVAALPGSTDAVASANLQQRMAEMTTRSGATVTSTETLPATAAGEYRRIALHISATATWPGVVTLLQAIDGASPRMLVDDLQLLGPRLVVTPAEPPLQLSFTVYAFRPGTPATSRP